MKYSGLLTSLATFQAAQGATNQRTSAFYPGASGPWDAMMAAQINDTVLVNPTVYKPFAITLPRTINVKSADATKKYTLDVGGAPNRCFDLSIGVGGVFEDGIICNNKVEWANAAGFWPNGGAYSLTLRRMVLHDLNNGILAGDHRDASILIEDCEAYDCGDYNGFGHNLYVGAVKSFVARRLYSHMVRNRGDGGMPNWTISWGHLLKTRAQNALIEDSRLLQEHGESNRCLDCPNGGIVLLQRTQLELSPNNPNNQGYGQFMSYGVEEETGGNPIGLPAHELRILNNTFTNDGGALKKFMFIKNTLPAVYTNTGNTYIHLASPYVQGDSAYEPSATSNTFVP